MKRFRSIVCLAWASSRKAEESSSAGVGGCGKTETCPTETPTQYGSHSSASFYRELSRFPVEGVKKL